ncbi:MAG: hypothetical protein QF786_06405, partial [Vicinamibacterales bacterium]|nr:hypothetical protein [Vicinamibacterales bacterium]
MSNSRFCWFGACACAMALVSTDAAAQERPNRVTVAVNMAVGSFWGEESHLGGVTCPPEIVPARAVEFGCHDQEVGCHA